MRIHRRSLITAVLVVVGVMPARGQDAPDPSGHWQGSVDARGTRMAFEIDLQRRDDGRFIGALSVAAQKITGLPLTKVAVDGRTVAFHARSDQPFTGTLSADRQSIAGEFLISGNSLPFVLTRTGEPRVPPLPRSASISTQLEGTWTGTVAAEGVEERLVMTLENHADGTGSGRIVNEDEGGLELPITIAQHGASVTIDTIPIASTFVATLNDAATELTGTMTQGPVTAHVSFRRAK